MAWSGPATGAAQYQPPPFANGQPGYSQPQQYQYGQQAAYGQYQGGPAYPQGGPPQRPPDNRPPKKKGNPIITRYPPPPGYRGPAQPQGPYGTNQNQGQYQPPQQAYPQAYSGAPSYPNQGYSAPSTYPPAQGYSPQGYGPPQNYPPQPNYQQPPYSQGPGYQYPQPAYPPNQGYSQAPSHQGGHGGQSYAPQQGSFQGYPPQPVHVDSNQQAFSHPHGWQQSNGPTAYSHDQYSSYGGAPAIKQDPEATPTPTSAQIAGTQQTFPLAQTEGPKSEQSAGEKPQLFLAWDDWDFDFDGAIWPKSNEPVDPNLSLGVIIWRPAKQVTRALPCTFSDAEEQALKPPAEKLGNGESVSNYFTLENSHEAFLDVRQTDEWPNIRADPIFVVFDDNDVDLIPIEDCISKRDRPDEPFEEAQGNEDEDMKDSSWNVMDNLEQALSGEMLDTRPPPPTKDVSSSRNQTQEDILAALGVTGSPKPPSNEPMPFPFPSVDEKPPASLPEKPPAPQPQLPSEQPPQRSHSYGGHRNSDYVPRPQRPYGSMSSSTHTRPPPPPQERRHVDSWTSGNSQNYINEHALDGSRESPARSEGSNRTLVGSDFEAEPPANANSGDKSQPPSVPKLERSDSSFSRKRSYDDTDQDDEKLRQQDDHTRRKKRPQVAAAYSRR
ncbi:uncharacterized protein BDR25DRAFT_125665 [Lindgomyces ingoldianus]|uniref:Uncharacterized protein n=1 Tax=Lindgomyces ingoldianus TaxID=673940 RepID=A0ACB6R5Q6_9PLEO|nr:uncharacterized protein BDR25DRAFT_125665 [Lindgomyces ingoldianus]KAF2473862.1 hypothetical protein BDR25DRAFT_125665 [Lindgomyces ingoldianus]